MNSYRITFRFYDISPRYAYIMAENQRDAFSKAHAFISPEDDCCEIIPQRVKKADVPEYTPVGRIRNPYERKALIYAESRGIYEYSLNGATMEYWSLLEDGFWKTEVNLENYTKSSERKIPWTGPECIPEFLLGEEYTDAKGKKHRATKYNYMVR